MFIQNKCYLCVSKIKNMKNLTSYLQAKNPVAFEAAQVLIHTAIRPPQIDYVSPKEKVKIHKAENIIYNNKEYSDFVESEIDEYYSEDGMAQYDCLF